MICNNCGRNIENENANFCENCGLSFRDSLMWSEQSKNNNKLHIGESADEKKDDKGGAISFGNWMGSLLLPFIPFVGPIIYIVMLFIWSFGPDAKKDKKNWARAQLIVTVLVGIFFIYLMTNTMNAMSNGTQMEEFKSIYNQLYGK